jgi:uncharacterized protein (DUF1330 family)
MADVGYSLAFARDMIPEKMKAYSAALPPIYATHGGHYLAIGGPGRGVEHLAGSWGPRAVMLGQFPTREAVSEFWWGEAYRAAARLRVGAVTVDACAFAGKASQAAIASLLIIACADARELSLLAASREAGATLAQTAAVEVLEGDLAGFGISVLSFASTEASQAAWDAQRAATPTLPSGVHVYRVARAAPVAKGS